MSDASPQTELRWGIERARTELDERIRLGEHLLAQCEEIGPHALERISIEDLKRPLRIDDRLQEETWQAFEQVEEGFRTWNQYNRTMLRQMFSDMSVHDEYRGRIGRVPGRKYPLKEEIEYLQTRIETRVSRLRVVRKSLHMFAIASGERAASSAGDSIFIIHGHDRAAALELKSLLKDEFDLDAILMDEKPHEGMTTLIAKFEREAEGCGFAIALFTPDDFVREGDVEYAQMRPNVLFELGWFCGHLGRQKACILYKEGTQIPSDLLGVGYYEFHRSPEERLRQLREELRKAGVLGDQ